MSQRWLTKVLLAVGLAVPSLVVRLGHIDIGPEWSVLVFGAAVFSAAFLLTWAAEAAQVDISASLAVAVLALIAVLPEYAVDLYFAYTAGHRPEFAQYAAANMTGSNRLLLGLGWPLVALFFLWGARRRGARPTEVKLEQRRVIELSFLAIAGIYAFLIPLTRRISLLDSVVLLSLFMAYGWRVAKEARSEPELIGVAARLAALSAPIRRTAVVGLFLLAAAFILGAAEPFAHALVESGKTLGIDEFLLVQWLAPLASESPEFLVAIMLAWRGKGDLAVGTLLSSKVNQWTLLVGGLPLAYAAGGGGWSLPLDGRQNGEFFLTAAQSVLGIAVLVDLTFGMWEAVVLLCLFVLQLFFPQQEVRFGFSVAYLMLASVILFRRRVKLGALVKSFWPVRSRASGAEAG